MCEERNHAVLVSFVASVFFVFAAVIGCGSGSPEVEPEPAASSVGDDSVGDDTPRIAEKCSGVELKLGSYRCCIPKSWSRVSDVPGRVGLYRLFCDSKGAPTIFEVFVSDSKFEVYRDGIKDDFNHVSDVQVESVNLADRDAMLARIRGNYQPHIDHSCLALDNQLTARLRAFRIPNFNLLPFGATVERVTLNHPWIRSGTLEDLRVIPQVVASSEEDVLAFREQASTAIYGKRANGPEMRARLCTMLLTFVEERSPLSISLGIYDVVDHIH